MSLIKIIPGVAEIIKWSSLEQLQHIIDHWVDEKDEHYPADVVLVAEGSFIVDSVNIDKKYYVISQMQ